MSDELLVAAVFGDTESVRRELDSGADPNYARKEMWHAFLNPKMGFGRERLTEFLARNHKYQFADEITRSRSGLFLALAQGHENAAELLIQRGADPNTRDESGVTPLSLASTRGLAAAAYRLLEAGADPDAPSKSGATALLIAIGGGSAGMFDESHTGLGMIPPSVRFQRKTIGG